MPEGTQVGPQESEEKLAHQVVGPILLQRGQQSSQTIQGVAEGEFAGVWHLVIHPGAIVTQTEGWGKQVQVDF